MQCCVCQSKSNVIFLMIPEAKLKLVLPVSQNKIKLVFVCFLGQQIARLFLSVQKH